MKKMILTIAILAILLCGCGKEDVVTKEYPYSVQLDNGEEFGFDIQFTYSPLFNTDSEIAACEQDIINSIMLLNKEYQEEFITVYAINNSDINCYRVPFSNGDVKFYFMRYGGFTYGNIDILQEYITDLKHDKEVKEVLANEEQSEEKEECNLPTDDGNTEITEEPDNGHQSVFENGVCPSWLNYDAEKYYYGGEYSFSQTREDGVFVGTTVCKVVNHNFDNECDLVSREKSIMENIEKYNEYYNSDHVIVYAEVDDGGFAWYHIVYPDNGEFYVCYNGGVLVIGQEETIDTCRANYYDTIEAENEQNEEYHTVLSFHGEEAYEEELAILPTILQMASAFDFEHQMDLTPVVMTDIDEIKNNAELYSYISDAIEVDDLSTCIGWYPFEDMFLYSDNNSEEGYLTIVVFATGSEEVEELGYDWECIACKMPSERVSEAGLFPGYSED